MPHRHIHAVIILSGNRSAISCKVLYTSHNSRFIRQVIPLQSVHSGLSNLSSIIRVLTCAFHHTSPTRIPAYIHHSSKSPVKSCSRRFTCRASCTSLYSLKIKTCSLSQWKRKTGSETMYHIKSENQRNLQSRFHCSLLILSCIGSPGYIEHGTQQSLAYILCSVYFRIVRSCSKSARTLTKLTYLLLNSHFPHQLRHEPVHFPIF